MLSFPLRFYGPVPLGLLRGRVFMKFKASLSEFYAWTPSMWPPPIPELKEPPAKLDRSNKKKIEEVIRNEIGSAARDSQQVPAQVVKSDADIKRDSS
jgi:hypothetical protein